jgi:hypothetical protein
MYSIEGLVRILTLPFCRPNFRHSFLTLTKAVTVSTLAGFAAHSTYRYAAMLRASDAFPGSESDHKVREIKAWLKTRGVRDFEPVTLFSDQLTKARISLVPRSLN